MVVGMSAWTGHYPHVAEALMAIITNAVARWGADKHTLQLDRPCKAKSNKQWREFCEHKDSVAFISWCADKIQYWASPGFAKYTIQAPLYNKMTKQQSFKIMSPDGRTDWTLAIWHVCRDTKCTVPFTKDVLQKIEAALAA